MRSYTCPACGAPGAFQSSVSVYAVCPYCQSMILRRDVDVEAFGKMAALPPDMSPLQIGTRGMLNGVGFALLGRVKIGWQDGNWNEWFLLTEDARRGWLAEAQGFFAACFEVPLNESGRALVNRNFATWKPKPGERVNVGEQVYEVTDIKQTVCLGSEGELPFLANRGRKALSIDLEGAGGFANLEIHRDEARLYQGHYVDWDALKLDNTRPLEGW
jgi:DNA-directed RNA polymerase subunit RPC12/RpoP